MKWVIAGIGGIVGLAVLGYALWHNFAVDAGRPEFIRRYQESFVESCVTATTAKIVAAGKTVDDALKEKVDRVCTCGAEASVKEFEKRGDVTLATMMSLENDPVFMSRVVEIMESCSQDSPG